MLALRLWNFGVDDNFISSFLQGMAMSHGESIRDETWFHWKFEASPYGKAILACAFDEEKVAGCVAFGRGLVKYNNKIWYSALSYETFVHPDYQGKGLFKKLVKIAEEEMRKQKIDFLYNFPNSNSLPGFMHLNWNNVNAIKEYKIKLLHPFRVMLHPTDLRKPFVPNESNFRLLDERQIKDLHGESFVCQYDVITPIWTQEYIKWRFYEYPNREYQILDNDQFFAISMVGMRGRLSAAELLYIEGKNGNAVMDVMPLVVEQIRSRVGVDVLCYSSTKNDNALNKTHIFVTVPSHSNFCYKILNERFVLDNGFKMVIPSINAHTY